MSPAVKTKLTAGSEMTEEDWQAVIKARAERAKKRAAEEAEKAVPKET